MTAVRLDPKTEDRLNKLAKITGRTKSYYLREALEKHLEDIEDYYLAIHRLENPGRLYSSKEAANELGL